MPWVTCDCGHKFEMYGGENKSCPKCGQAAKGTSSNWIKCGSCGTKVEVHSGQTKVCPHCSRTVSA
jgi:DNA-directed RNA polymerase subunit RPC12/RpoP